MSYAIPVIDMAQDKEREMINSATEAAQQLIDVIFDINCAANKWPSYAARSALGKYATTLKCKHLGISKKLYLVAF